MFEFWEESSGPNMITLLKLFLRRALRFQLQFVILIILSSTKARSGLVKIMLFALVGTPSVHEPTQ
jgi:hypothetical protein